MDSYKLAVKWFARDSSNVAPEALLPVFQSWIQNRSIPAHQLIDVANYAHVVRGPGVALIAHEGNFAYDLAEDQPGILYTRQRPLAGTFEERLLAACAAALGACVLLEQSPGIAFQTDRALFRITDRLLAPNTAETFRAIESQLNAFFARLFAGPVTLEYRADAHRPFEVQVRASLSKASPSELLARLV